MKTYRIFQLTLGMVFLLGGGMTQALEWGFCDACGDTYEKDDSKCEDKRDTAVEKAFNKGQKAVEKAESKKALTPEEIDEIVDGFINPAQEKADLAYQSCQDKAWKKFGKCCQKAVEGKYREGKSWENLKDEIETVDTWYDTAIRGCAKKSMDCVKKCNENFDTFRETEECAQNCFEDQSDCVKKFREAMPSRVNDGYKRVLTID